MTAKNMSPLIMHVKKGYWWQFFFIFVMHCKANANVMTISSLFFFHIFGEILLLHAFPAHNYIHFELLTRSK